jgi:hypothetical protein
MLDNNPQLPKTKKDLSIWKRIVYYFLFAIAITALLFFLTPGYFLDEAIADILLMILVAIIELRKGNK